MPKAIRIFLHGGARAMEGVVCGGVEVALCILIQRENNN